MFDSTQLHPYWKERNVHVQLLYDEFIQKNTLQNRNSLNTQKQYHQYTQSSPVYMQGES
jgi:hypothetical protein